MRFELQFWPKCSYDSVGLSETLRIIPLQTYGALVEGAEGAPLD
jgi:hypothetical protein